jgi:predicted negative regulator of RcsB-dependent stress response
VDDLLSDKEQWEAFKGWLKENGAWIVGGVALGALALYGWRWWEARQDSISMEASMKYEQIMAAYERGDRTQAITSIGELEREHADSPYVDQARLAEARMHVQSNQLDKAAASLKTVMESTKDPNLALIARLRLARVQMAQNKLDDALATLNAVKDPGAFSAGFSEARGDLYHAKSDKNAALKEYRAARADVTRGSADTELLDLKINDLTGGAPEGGKP